MDFLATFEPIINAGASYVFIIGALFMRISAISFLAPGIAERYVPTRVRLAVAVAMTLILAPIMLSNAPKPPQTPSALAVLYAAEAISGLLIGFSLRIVIFVLEIAGSIAAQHISLSQLFGANVGFDPSSPFSAILVMGGLALAAGAGVHFHLMNALAQTYEILPFGAFPGTEETGAWSAARLGSAMMKALALASPFVILGFIYSLALAAASRAMPQLMAAFVGAPAITIAGLALFAITAPVILTDWLAGFERVLIDPLMGRL